MNNFKLLTETKTVITSWAVPCDAVLDELDTLCVFGTYVEQVREKGEVINPLKAQVEIKKTLAFEELTPEEQHEMTLYEATSPLDHVMDAAEMLLVQLPAQDLSVLVAIENLEALQRLIAQRIEELKD
jgi:hypothetical protein